MRTPTIEAAHGRWPGILQALGVDPKFLRDKHGPCPICGGKDRFRYDDRGDGLYFCSGCGPGNGFQLLMKLNSWDFKKTCSEVNAVVGIVQETTQRETQTEGQKLAAIQRVKEGSLKVRPSDPVALYLERRRCFATENVLADIRFHPALRHYQTRTTHPGMIAKLRYPDGSEASLHRTYLTLDGRKADVDPVRMMMPGRPLETAAIRLGPIGQILGIAEGIETALCASRRFGIPIWSAVSAGGLTSWEPPEGVRAVVICGDNDSNFVGQEAAYRLARRLAHKHLDVEVMIPVIHGIDWADPESSAYSKSLTASWS